MIAQEHHKSPGTARSPHQDFLRLMPVVQRYARLFFQGWPPAHREEAMAEAVAAALVSFISLKRRGKAPFQFPSVIALRAVQHVRDDRHVGSRFNSRDVLSPKARHCHGFAVASISLLGPCHEALIDNRQTPVPDQVWFRCDVPVWLRTLQRRNRRIALLLAQGYTTREVARRFRVSSARISQLRRELHDSWQRFQGEPTARRSIRRKSSASRSRRRIARRRPASR